MNMNTNNYNNCTFFSGHFNHIKINVKACGKDEPEKEDRKKHNLFVLFLSLLLCVFIICVLSILEKSFLRSLLLGFPVSFVIGLSLIHI